MPNSLGRDRRRRSDGAETAAKKEIDDLKQELSDLRKLYMQDMANVSSDMRTLVSQLQASKSSDTPAEDNQPS